MEKFPPYAIAIIAAVVAGGILLPSAINLGKYKSRWADIAASGRQGYSFDITDNPETGNRSEVRRSEVSDEARRGSSVDVIDTPETGNLSETSRDSTDTAYYSARSTSEGGKRKTKRKTKRKKRRSKRT